MARAEASRSRKIDSTFAVQNKEAEVGCEDPRKSCRFNVGTLGSRAVWESEPWRAREGVAVGRDQIENAGEREQLVTVVSTASRCSEPAGSVT